MPTPQMSGPMAKAVMIVMAAILMHLPAYGADPAYEDPPVLNAKDHLPAKFFKDDRYKIDPKVPTDGFLAEYTLTSKFGTFKAKGPGRVAILINEIIALYKLEDLENSDEFQAGAKKAATDTGESVKTWVDKPIETAKGIPEGVGRFFQRTYRAAKTGVQTLGDVKQGHKPGTETASGQDAGALELASAALKRLGQVTVDAFGYDEARRTLAKHLQVDPYTTNPVLTQKLDEVAWSSFTGSLGINVAVSMIPGGTLLKSSHMVTDWVWDMSPGDLRVKNDKTLQQIGVPQDEIDRFLRHHLFTTTLQTALVQGLDQLKKVKGRSEVIPWALTAENQDQAHFMVWAVRMLAEYHQNQSPLTRIEIYNSLAGRTDQGQVVVVGPVDYLSWSNRLHEYATRAEFKDHSRSLWLAGEISEQGRKQLAELGWDIHSRALFEQIESALE